MLGTHSENTQHTQQHSTHESFQQPTRWRRISSSTIDLLVHVVIAAAVAGTLFASQSADPGSTTRDERIATAVLALVVTWLIVSFLHRTIIQANFRRTLGKWTTGLIAVRHDNHAQAGVLYLVDAWIAWAVYRLSDAFDFPILNDERPAVVVQQRDHHVTS